MRADGSNPVGFFIAKMAFWGDLGSFEGSDGKIVRSDCKTALGWQKCLFGVFAGD